VLFGYTVGGDETVDMSATPNQNGLKFMYSKQSFASLLEEYGFVDVWTEWVQGKEPVGDKLGLMFFFGVKDNDK